MWYRYRHQACGGVAFWYEHTADVPLRYEVPQSSTVHQTTPGRRRPRAGEPMTMVCDACGETLAGPIHLMCFEPVDDLTAAMLRVREPFVY